MSNAKQNQNWIRGTRGRTATAALASAILFVLEASRLDRPRRKPSPRWQISRAAPMGLIPYMGIRLPSVAQTVMAYLPRRDLRQGTVIQGPPAGT